MDILTFDKVSLTYQTVEGETTALKDVTFSVREGEFVSLVGPSGCGKTTILSMIAGLLKATSGEILIDGKLVDKPTENMGYMLQRDHLFSWRTIEKNVLLPLEIKKCVTEEKRQYALSILNKYGLGKFVKNYPNSLSGGMKQRVALIRTLVSDPKLLLLDEPFSALDSQTRLDVSDDVYKIIKAEGKTAILVTHDISEAIAMSDVIIVLTDRPAKVKKIIIPNIEGSSPLRRRENSKFSSVFENVWKELH